MFVEIGRSDFKAMILVLDAMGHGASADNYIRVAHRTLHRNRALLQCARPCELLRGLHRSLLASREFQDAIHNLQFPYLVASAVLIDPPNNCLRIASNIPASLYRFDGTAWYPLPSAEIELLGFSWENPDDPWNVNFECLEGAPLSPLPHALLGLTDWIDQPTPNNTTFRSQLVEDLNTLPREYTNTAILNYLLARAQHHYPPPGFPPDDQTLFLLRMCSPMNDENS